MKNTRLTVVLASLAFAGIVAAQGQQTPEQKEAAAKAANKRVNSRRAHKMSL